MTTADPRKPPSHGPVQAWCATSRQPGAVAVIELAGDVAPLLERLTGVQPPGVGAVRLADLAGIDRGLVIRLADDRAAITPHGGLRIVERLLERLRAAGALVDRSESIDPTRLYPEASDRWEALALAAISRAASPMAIDLLMQQPDRWRRWAAANGDRPTDDDLSCSLRLNRLLTPPLVVVVGLPNVGKSTLTNRLAGRRVSIEADLPGTTRDYVAARIDLAGLVVNLIDTPGLLEKPGEADAAALTTAGRIIEQADLLIALTDHEQPWPTLPRQADLRVANKADRCSREDADISISALNGRNVEVLVSAVAERLVPRVDREHPGVWVFDVRLVDGSFRHLPQQGAQETTRP